MKRGIAALLIAPAIALGGLTSCTAVASADPTGTGVAMSPLRGPAPLAPECEHRGPGHWDRHGGLEDDRWHLAHAQLVTCHDQDDGKPHPDDRDREPVERKTDERHDDEHHLPGHREHKWWRND